LRAQAAEEVDGRGVQSVRESDGRVGGPSGTGGGLTASGHA
jgi:hypothetical protein